MFEPSPISPVMVAPLRHQEAPAPPHFSERSSWRMNTTFLWMFVLTCAVGGLAWYGQNVSEHFLGPESLEAIWDAAFPLVLLVGPMAIIMLGSGLDLSVGAVAALASVVTASALADGKSPQDAFILAMMFSGGIGLLHALLVGVAVINPIILTLVTALLIQSATVLYAAGQPVLLGQDAGFLGTLHNWPIVVGVSFGVSLLLVQLAQIGGGAGGIPVARQSWYRRTFFIALPYVLSSLAAGVVGCSLAGRYPMAIPCMDQEMPLMVILAAVIGGNCVGRRFGTVFGAVAGVAILAASKRLMLMEAVEPRMQTLILAAAAGAALLLSQTIYGIINLFYRNSRRNLAA